MTTTMMFAEFNLTEPEAHELELLKALLLSQLHQSIEEVMDAIGIATLNCDGTQGIAPEHGIPTDGEQLMPRICMLKAISDSVTRFIDCSRPGKDCRQSFKRIWLSIDSFTDVYLRFCKERKEHFVFISKSAEGLDLRRFKQKIQRLDLLEANLLERKVYAEEMLESVSTMR